MRYTPITRGATCTNTRSHTLLLLDCNLRLCHWVGIIHTETSSRRKSKCGVGLGMNEGGGVLFQKSPLASVNSTPSSSRPSCLHANLCPPKPTTRTQHKCTTISTPKTTGVSLPPSLSFFNSLPQLTYAGCSQVMQILDECHARGFLHTMTGACNEAKRDVNACLRAERLERTAKNRAKAKVAREKTLELWKEIDENS